MIDEEKRHNIFSRDQFLCGNCGKHIVTFGTPQLAHKIRQGKQAQTHVMIYIWNKHKKDRSRRWCKNYILDNELNLVSTCCGSCNSHFNIFSKDVERDALIDRIIFESDCLNTGRVY